MKTIWIIFLILNIQVYANLFEKVSQKDIELANKFSSFNKVDLLCTSEGNNKTTIRIMNNYTGSQILFARQLNKPDIIYQFFSAKEVIGGVELTFFEQEGWKVIIKNSFNNIIKINDGKNNYTEFKCMESKGWEFLKSTDYYKLLH